MNDGAERWKRSRKTDWEEQCSPRLWCSPIFLYIIVLNLGTIRLQRTKRGIKHQPRWRQKAKFTFPFWKLRKSELFYLQLFFWRWVFRECGRFFLYSFHRGREKFFVCKWICCFIQSRPRMREDWSRTHTRLHAFIPSVCLLPSRARKSQFENEIIVEHVLQWAAPHLIEPMILVIIELKISIDKC